jgi:hypothetical protein
VSGACTAAATFDREAANKGSVVGSVVGILMVDGSIVGSGEGTSSAISSR